MTKTAAEKKSTRWAAHTYIAHVRECPPPPPLRGGKRYAIGPVSRFKKQKPRKFLKAESFVSIASEQLYMHLRKDSLVSKHAWVLLLFLRSDVSGSKFRVVNKHRRTKTELSLLPLHCCVSFLQIKLLHNCTLFLMICRYKLHFKTFNESLFSITRKEECILCFPIPWLTS